MSSIVAILRKTGLAPRVRRLAHAFGYEILPRAQHSPSTWAGLRALPIRTVLDIGAFSGDLAQTLSRSVFPQAVTHAFEPSPRQFPHLKAVADRSSGAIFAHHCAVGDHCGAVDFHILIDSPASSSILPPTEEDKRLFPGHARIERVTVPMRTLDDLVETLSPSVVDDMLIKVDVQGYEDRVIAGGLRTFARARACILETNRARLYEGQPSFREIFLALDALGYEYVGNLDQYHGADGAVVYFDAVFVRPEKGLMK
jgi:FkbM family methyltransferase